jgi:hypothetical protein
MLEEGRTETSGDRKFMLQLRTTNCEIGSRMGEEELAVNEKQEEDDDEEEEEEEEVLEGEEEEEVLKEEEGEEDERTDSSQSKSQVPRSISEETFDRDEQRNSI